MSESFNPTRMELIDTKNQIKLAEKGHKLLKQKRDFLVTEFLSMLDETRALKKTMIEKIKEAYTSLAIAESYHSIFELENATLSIKEILGVRIRERNVMGVRLPVIKKYFSTKSIGERGYSILGTSAKLDEVSTNFQKALDVVIDIAESEISLRKLLLEIERTKRRVNALEYVIIPRLFRKRNEIQFRLDEMERENFVTLKALKSIINPA